MACMGRYVTSFVICVNSNVEAHQFPECLVCEPELIGVVGTVVKSTISCWNVLVVTIFVVENYGSDSGNLGAHINCIVKG